MSEPTPKEPTHEQRFDDALKRALAVPKEEILRREAEYKRQRMSRTQKTDG